MRRPCMFLSFFLIFFILQSSTYADPTITVRFCSSGFEIGIAPTDWGVIYVSTGLYSAEPMSAGECIPDYDPTTQLDHFYIVNSSGTYHIGQYHEYGSGNNTLTERLERVKKHVFPVFGRVEDGNIIFRVEGVNYTVPVGEVLPYLWSKDMVNALVAFPEGNGLVIVPTGIIDIVEDNFTIARKRGMKVGTTLVDFNFTYRISYRYPLYLNGSMNGRFVWGSPGKEEGVVTWDELTEMFQKPLYVFYFNGSSVRPIPLIRVQISLRQVSLALSPKYSFENLASPYSTNGSITSSTTANSSVVFTPSTTLKPQSLNHTTAQRSSNQDNRKNNSNVLLLLAVLGLSAMALIVCRRGAK
ncbi:hypothetical protein [Thermococcus sp. 21S7]|uniref:hypothetical protein n=1 Tax=Thermococcus sp. 21S7 TaxID=1638221 RepID=UPI00143A9E80|nr:hypothetical protein [Thermococcus sp. 21S7]NJE61280.1 hypothetical protein [Thermococcus sp. 21S7]